MTLAKDGSPTYAALTEALGLQSGRELEDLVVSAIYANLVKATLDPKRQLVQLNSVAALRDPAPGSVPGLLSSLRAWAARCESTLADLEAQMDAVRTAADRRAAAARDQDGRTARLVEDELVGRDRKSSSLLAQGQGEDLPPMASLAMGHASLLRAQQQRFGKRGPGHMDSSTSAGEYEDEAMDLDEEDDPQDGKKRASRRKI
jgi:COP9 signalosome complex subunit 7